MKAGRKAMWHQRVALPPPCCTTCSHNTSDWSPAAGSQRAVWGGCSQTFIYEFSNFILWQVHHSQITFSSTFHHKLRVQILLSCSPTVVPQTPHSPFSHEWVARTHCPSGKHQELRKWAAGITQDLSKRKSEGQTRSSLFFSRMDETGDYSDSSSSLSILWWLVAPQQQCLATGTQQARKSKQKPPLPPQGQIWQEKQH